MGVLILSLIPAPFDTSVTKLRSSTQSIAIRKKDTSFRGRLKGGKSLMLWLKRNKNKIDEGKIVFVPVDKIDLSPFELRKINEDPSEEGFTQLVRSIGLHGLLQPIVLRPHPSYKNKKRYQVIAGGRRLRASKAAHLATVPAVIKLVSNNEMRTIALIENILRREMKDYEKAHALKTIYEVQGYDLETAIKHIGAIENLKRGEGGILNIPTELLQLSSEIGYSPRTQRRYLELLSGLKPGVFEYTEKIQLQTEKKEMLARKGLRGDARLQKIIANLIKDIPAREARQLVHSIETGSYILTGNRFKSAEERLKCVGKVDSLELDKEAYVTFLKTSNLAKDMLHQLTGIKKRTYSIRSIRRTKQYRADTVGKLSDRELKIFWNNMSLLKEGMEDMLGMIEQELGSRANTPITDATIQQHA